MGVGNVEKDQRNERVDYGLDKGGSIRRRLPDAALEAAAGKYWEVGNPFIIAFCSGLDTCPA
jgi:hypothetical protein